MECPRIGDGAGLPSAIRWLLPLSPPTAASVLRRYKLLDGHRQGYSDLPIRHVWSNPDSPLGHIRNAGFIDPGSLHNVHARRLLRSWGTFFIRHHQNRAGAVGRLAIGGELSSRGRGDSPRPITRIGQDLLSVAIGIVVIGIPFRWLWVRAGQLRQR